MTFEGTFQENKRPVVTTAPDCLVYLNGRLSLPSGSDPNKRVNIQPLIDSVQVSLSVESPPGTAQISMHIPKHYEQDFFVGGSPIISNMMEVQVYMKGHYKVEGAPRYYPTFWGVVQSVSYSESPGERTLDISCQDILYWWNRQRININPSQQGADTAKIGRFNVQGSGYFTKKNPFSIMYTLSRFSYGDSMNANVYPGDRQHRPEMTEREGQSLMRRWTRKWGRIQHSLRMFGPNGRVVQGSDLAGLVDDRFDVHRDGKVSDAAKNRNKQQKTFQQTDDIKISDIAPFEQVASKMANIEVWTSDFQTKMDIANTVKEAIGYEFFMDVTGELVFKPPFWNLDVIPNKPVSWIRPVDVINASFNQNVPEATMIEATGLLRQNMDVGGPEVAKPRATYIDYDLVQKFGWDPTNYESSFYGSGSDGNSPQNLFYHLIDRLDRENLNRNNGSMDIPIRPELRLGYPVYIEHKDCYYYIESIDHSFNYGSQCTTSLTLKGKRDKFYAAFDSWSAASANDLGEEPEPGAKTTPNLAPAPGNINNRPPEKRTGRPEPDKNVNLVFEPDLAKTTFQEGEDKQDIQAWQERKHESDKIQQQIVSMRTEFALNGPASFVYQVDPNRDKPVQRDDKTGKKTGGPLTRVKPEERTYEVNGTTRSVNVAKYPISDERGYKVIGGYEYGRSASITTRGLEFNASDTYSDIQRLLNMSPNDTQTKDATYTGTNIEVDPSKDQNLRINPNNYGRRLNEIVPQGKEGKAYAGISDTRGISELEGEVAKRRGASAAQDVAQRAQQQAGGGGQTGGQDGPIISTERSFSRTNDVSRWRPVIEEVRQETGASEEKFPDRLILAAIQVESNGMPNARGKAPDGDLKKHRGLLQISPANAKSVDSTSNNPSDYQGKGPNDIEAARQSIKHYIKWQQKHDYSHNYDEDLMGLAWKAGQGTANTYRKKREAGASRQELKRYLQSRFNGKTDEYLAKHQKARGVWTEGSANVEVGIDAPSDPGPKASEQVESDGLRDEFTSESPDEALQSAIAKKRLQENLESTPNALPEDMPTPRDTSIMPIINDYLKRLYKRAFTEESADMYETRTGESKIESIPNPVDIIEGQDDGGEE